MNTPQQDNQTASDDTRRLGQIRQLLADFDWEFDDGQYALEAIDRIANAEDPAS